MKKLTPIQLVWALVAVNFIWRLVWLPFNQGASTDGILQLMAFERGESLWPPLFTLLAHGLGWIPGLGLEGAGRFISILAGSLAVVPIEFIGRKLFGLRAAIFGALCYTFTPIPLRWGVAPQNDSLFMALWMACLAASMMASILVWPELFDQGKEKSKSNIEGGTRWLMLASLLGVLASLTRYQGVILLPAVFLVIRAVDAARKKADADAKPKMNPWSALLPWIIIVAWFAFAGRGAVATQVQTMSTRSGAPGAGLLAGVINFWYMLEQFVLMSPYFVTYGIFGFFIYGLTRINFATKRLTNSVLIAAMLTAAILVLQSSFHAYQSRYLLPIIPIICLLAGHGLAVWEKRCKDKDTRFYALAGATFAFAIFFSSLVGAFNGRTFMDMKQAGQWLKKNAPANAKIYAIEAYQGFDPAKLEFWSGRRDIERYQLQYDLNPGDFIVLPSFYGSWGIGKGGAGGYTSHRELLDYIKKRETGEIAAEATVLHPAKQVEKFSYSTFPLLPDIMEEPLTHTNPLAWYLRYRRQTYETIILKVAPIGEAPAEPAVAPAEGAATSNAPTESGAPAEAAPALE